MADWVDLKSPYFTGHSTAVADLAATAARTRGLTRDEVRLVHRAGLLHDLGRIGVSNAIWDKTAPLTSAETERIRLHSYYTERMLTDPAALARIGAVAGAAHERLDGTGYHPRHVALDQILRHGFLLTFPSDPDGRRTTGRIHHGPRWLPLS